MRVTKNHIVWIDYIIRLRSGDIVETSIGEAPLGYLHGRSQILPGIERAIEGMEVGDERVVELEPEEGYGERDAAGVFLVPRAAFPAEEELHPGMSFSALRSDGEPILFRVLRADSDAVLVDGNHPLAGKSLVVWIAVRAVREATDDERRLGLVSVEETAPPNYLS